MQSRPAGQTPTHGRGRVRASKSRPSDRAGPSAESPPALRSAVRWAARPRTRKSKKAVTADVLEALLATCKSDRFADACDAALLLDAFASGRAAAAKWLGCAAQRGGAGSLRPLRSQVLRPAVFVDPAWPHQDHRGRRGRKGVSGRASGRGAAGMAVAGGHCKGAGVPGDRSMGGLDDKALTPRR